jgi:hypothetical protein
MQLKLYHISYSEDTLRAKPPGFELLDNACNQRPDWFEYWPIRNYLLSKSLDDQNFYGFLSPRFILKTGYDFDLIHKNMLADEFAADLYFCAPQYEVGAIFQNPYFGAEATDPGSLETFRLLLQKNGLDPDFAGFVSDSRKTVFSNYFFARPWVWIEWLKFCEKIFKYAEEKNLDAELYESLNRPTLYGKGAQRKIFMIEGVITFLLYLKNIKAKALPLHENRATPAAYSGINTEARICDALKISYNSTSDSAFLHIFSALADAAKHKVVQKSTDSHNVIYPVL